MEMGLVPGEDMTLDGASIVDNELGAVDHDIKALSQAIGQFQRGNYLAKTIDALGDGSGHVEQWEIDNYLKQNDIDNVNTTLNEFVKKIREKSKLDDDFKKETLLKKFKLPLKMTNKELHDNI